MVVIDKVTVYFIIGTPNSWTSIQFNYLRIPYINFLTWRILLGRIKWILAMYRLSQGFSLGRFLLHGVKLDLWAIDHMLDHAWCVVLSDPGSRILWILRLRITSAYIWYCSGIVCLLSVQLLLLFCTGCWQLIILVVLIDHFFLLGCLFLPL